MSETAISISNTFCCWKISVSVTNWCTILKCSGADRHYRDGIPGCEKGPRSGRVAQGLFNQIPLLILSPEHTQDHQQATIFLPSICAPNVFPEHTQDHQQAITFLLPSWVLHLYTECVSTTPARPSASNHLPKSYTECVSCLVSVSSVCLFFR